MEEIKGIGWFKIWRDLYSDPIWKCTTIKQKVILISILGMANFHENKWVWKGKKFNVKPGQFITSLESIKKIAGKNISIQNVRTALTLFEKTYEFLTNESTKTGRLISICNWEKYQGNDTDIDNVYNKWLTNTSQTPNKQLTTKEESKKEKKDKENNYTSSFTKFWEAYPKKIGKGAALRVWKQLKQVNDLLPVILTAIERQKNSEQWRKSNGQFIPNPATWLNQGRWEDEVDVDIQPSGIQPRYYEKWEEPRED